MSLAEGHRPSVRDKYREACEKEGLVKGGKEEKTKVKKLKGRVKTKK